jgi:tetratricopeptide (TPR) repeat protein
MTEKEMAMPAKTSELLTKARLTDNWQTKKQCYEEILRDEPENWEALYELGQIFQGSTEPETPVRYLESAERLNPNNALVKVALTKALFNARRLDDALNTIEAALRLEDRNAEAHFLKAMLLSSKGMKEESMVEGKLCLKYDPNHVMAKMLFR